MEFSDLEALQNRIVHSEDDQEIGSIAAVHFDGRTAQPLFVEVATEQQAENLVVPIVDATVQGRKLVLPYEADDVVRGPAIGPDETMSVGDVASVVRYYDAGWITFESHEVTEQPEVPEEPAGTRYRRKPLPPIVYQWREGNPDEW